MLILYFKYYKIDIISFPDNFNKCVVFPIIIVMQIHNRTFGDYRHV